MVRGTMQATSQSISSVASEIGEGNSIVNWQSRCILEERAREKVQERQRWDGSRGPQPANLTLPTRLKRSVKDFMFLCQVICWPSEGLFQLLLGSANKIRRGRRSSDIRSTCPSHRSLWLYSCSMTDMFLGLKTLCLTSVLLTLCSHQILPIFRRQRWSNTDSLRISSAFSG